MYAFSTLMPPQTVNASSLTATERMKIQKKQVYKRCLREVKHTSFTPLILSASGDGKGGHLILQKACILSRTKKGQELQLHHHMAQMLALIFTPQPSSASEVPAPQKASPFTIRFRAMSSCGRLSCQSLPKLCNRAAPMITGLGTGVVIVLVQFAVGSLTT